MPLNANSHDRVAANTHSLQNVPHITFLGFHIWLHTCHSGASPSEEPGIQNRCQLSGMLRPGAPFGRIFVSGFRGQAFSLLRNDGGARPYGTSPSKRTPSEPSARQ